MGLTFEPLGKFIHEVDVRNTDLSVAKLMGVNLSKQLMPSVANIVGTDLSTYKVVKKGQFACKLMSVGRDACLPIALKLDDEPIIISSAYYSFEVNDESKLMSEYLMMCFLRPDFDRELWFMTGGDVRGGVTWETFCSIKIPVLPIDEQRNCVDYFNKLRNRIEFLQKSIENAEDIEQALMTEAFDTLSSKCVTLGDVVEFIDGDRGSNYPTFDDFFKEEYCLFLSAANVTSSGFDFSDCVYITKDKDTAMNNGHLSRNDVVFTSRGTLGNVAFYDEFVPFENIRINSGMLILRPKSRTITPHLLFSMLKSKYMSVAIEQYKSGSAQPQLPIKDLQKVTFPALVNDSDIELLDYRLKKVQNVISIQKSEIECLNRVVSLFLTSFCFIFTKMNDVS